MFGGGREQKDSGHTGIVSDAKRRLDQSTTKSATLRVCRDGYGSKQRPSGYISSAAVPTSPLFSFATTI
jgi:hypothetical protein